jgi:hypothetical protein
MSFQELVVTGGVGAIVVMQGFILAKLSKIDVVAEKTNTLDTWAFGAKGNNGKNKDINDLKKDMDAVKRQVFGRRAGDLA